MAISGCKTKGCTDESATNFDREARKDDDSCEYAEEETGDFALRSVAVSDGALIDDYKCEEKTNDVENSIPLAWSNVPEGTGSLAIVMYHYPNGDQTGMAPNTYLFLWDIDPSVTEIPYGAADDGAWHMGPNKDGTAISYTSPCSPNAEPGAHTYYITLYALSETPASLPSESTLDMDWDTMQAAIESVTVVGESTLEFTD